MKLPYYLAHFESSLCFHLQTAFSFLAQGSVVLPPIPLLRVPVDFCIHYQAIQASGVLTSSVFIRRKHAHDCSLLNMGEHIVSLLLIIT
jgi:hypothetical protein